jgi:zinc transport system ATP-binding protein
MSDAPIVAEDLFFSFQSAQVLHQLNIRIKKGEFIGVIGPNGGGKTTFLKLLMGFLTPSRGRLRVLNGSPAEARLKIGYVPQIHRMDRDFPITVWELVLLGALSSTPAIGPVPKGVKEKALSLLEEFDLGRMRNLPFSSLSGGQAQKALFARALLSDPELLLLDEPTANIDPPTTRKILEKLDTLKRDKTILMVCHDLGSILERVDRVLCIQGHAHMFLPEEVCEHFALGLYHTPLLGLPKNHLYKEAHCHACAPR